MALWQPSSTMDDDNHIHSPFNTDHLWKRSAFLEDSATYQSSLFASIELDIPTIKFDHPYAPRKPLDHELRLPDLDSFEFGPLPDLDSVEDVSVSTESLAAELEDDIWNIALELGPADKDVRFFAWETFEDETHQERYTPYISESGPDAFDAALLQSRSKEQGNIATGRVIKGDTLLDSLWNLGLGRSSILFSFSRKLRTFVPAIHDGRPSGTSLESAKSLTNRFILTGNTFLYLRSFVERTFSSPTSIPARVALATCVSTILSTFEDHLGRHSQDIRSFLQLQRLFYKPQEILIYVARLVDSVRHAKTNEHLSSVIHHRALEIEDGDEHLRHISTHILCRVAAPSLELLGEWIGIRSEDGTTPIAKRGGFVVDENKESEGPQEYSYNPAMMPRFLSSEDGNIFFETGNSLRFLKTHHPGHPLSCVEKFGIQPPELEWAFGWQDIEAVASKAKAYEEQLRKAIQEFSYGKDETLQTDAQPEPSAASKNPPDDIQPDFTKYIEESTQLFDQPPKRSSNELTSELQLLVEGIVSDEPETAQSLSFSPPISLTSTLSFNPLLTTQAKLVNATTLRLFFRSHHLRLHLSLQRQYHLLGDGVFSSRLASALFDPDRETAERRKGTIRSGVHMGLQLGTRNEWPPASSELRLALTGVLSESYYESALYQSTQAAKHSSVDQPSSESHILARKETSSLPGQLNFAVRTLSENEMEKCMDPDSLYALDFLRLQYVSPSPLNLVITTASLEKYDAIFRFLLRLLRMLFVVSHLPRTYPDPESRFFRMEAHHFVTATAAYIFQTGIAEHWQRFEEFIVQVEGKLSEEDAAGELGTRVREGLEAIKARHEECLDGIRFSLLLRRRQDSVLRLLEQIFDCVLLFAKVWNRERQKDARREMEEREKENVKDLYDKLKGKIRAFVSVVKGLMGKKGYGKGRGSGEENSLERLAVLLEGNAYYAGGSGRR
ncbi:Spc98 family-domain-containing protein [Clohesyomyces aquaticus]|uniref:Spindle pole body component n=1 Tax=Clohesyomyces aquaticus TaxID=1231657 RepID=A0A1Y2A7P1_9PLEO|nr:Spc98 family-domain-containing protein [Clohesyomyces aquaticus]